MIPLHPQGSSERPDELHWLVPPGVLPFTARVAQAPSALAALMGDGTLAEVRLEDGAVITRLGPGHAWSVAGPRVRTALHAALADPAGWRPAPGTGTGTGTGTDDARLRAATQTLLDGPAGEFARSHGGTIDLVGVQDGIVEVRLGGACDGCPAARVTMRVRLERQLREQVPGLREIREAKRPRSRLDRSRFRTTSRAGTATLSWATATSARVNR